MARRAVPVHSVYGTAFRRGLVRHGTEHGKSSISSGSWPALCSQLSFLHIGSTEHSLSRIGIGIAYLILLESFSNFLELDPKRLRTEMRLRRGPSLKRRNQVTLDPFYARTTAYQAVVLPLKCITKRNKARIDHLYNVLLALLS